MLEENFSNERNWTRAAALSAAVRIFNWKSRHGICGCQRRVGPGKLAHCRDIKVKSVGLDSSSGSRKKSVNLEDCQLICRSDRSESLTITRPAFHYRRRDPLNYPVAQPIHTAPGATRTTIQDSYGRRARHLRLTFYR